MSRKCPAVFKTIRCLKSLVDLTAFHPFQFTIRAAKGEVRITAVNSENAIMGRQANSHSFPLISRVTQIDTHRCPVFPDYIRISLSNLILGNMPTLCDRFRLKRTAAQDVVGIEVRLTALTNGHSVDEEIKFETRIFIVFMTRRLQYRQILQQEDRISVCIHLKRILDSLGMVIGIPVPQTHRS